MKAEQQVAGKRVKSDDKLGWEGLPRGEEKTLKAKCVQEEQAHRAEGAEKVDYCR